MATIVATVAFAALSENWKPTPNIAVDQSPAGPAIGIGSEFSEGGPPVECSDNGGLARDCDTLLSIRSELAGADELNWSADIPISEWTGVRVFGQPTRVLAINLTTSGLTGTVPPELGELSELRALHLYGNDLSGEIPLELGLLANLDTLDLGDNQLAGSIPSELGRLSRLVSLDLSANRLTGDLPAQLGDLESLEWLVIAENELTGDVSEVLDSLPNLEYLSVYDNRFNGCVPTALKEVDGFLGDLPFCDAQ